MSIQRLFNRMELRVNRNGGVDAIQPLKGYEALRQSYREVALPGLPP